MKIKSFKLKNKLLCAILAAASTIWSMNSSADGCLTMQLLMLLQCETVRVGTINEETLKRMNEEALAEEALSRVNEEVKAEAQSSLSCTISDQDKMVKIAADKEKIKAEDIKASCKMATRAQLLQTAKQKYPQAASRAAARARPQGGR